VYYYNVQGNPPRQFDATIRDMVLRELALHFAHLNSSHDLAAFGLPTPAAQPANAVVADEIARYDVATQAAIRNERVPQLNFEQRVVYDNVMAAVDCRAFFVDGLGGIGKTFLYSCLLSIMRAQGRVAIVVASSGIAALLLDEGRTAHSRFKIPVQSLNSMSTCYINRDSDLAALLQTAALIVWDEAVMMHMHVLKLLTGLCKTSWLSLTQHSSSCPLAAWLWCLVAISGKFCLLCPAAPREMSSKRL